MRLDTPDFKTAALMAINECESCGSSDLKAEFLALLAKNAIVEGLPQEKIGDILLVRLQFFTISSPMTQL